MYNRIFSLNLKKNQSCFLWGPRQSGKSSFLRLHFKDSIYYDLLKTDDFIKLSKQPWLLREEIISLKEEMLEKGDTKQLIVIIDEVQKIPLLLNEVHWLIENEGISFILCGSSARQLRNKSVNLLGGRAMLFYFFPLVYKEINDIDKNSFYLLKALQNGLLPRHYLSGSEDIDLILKSYVNTYLLEEIQNEGIVRNLSAFAGFLEIVGISNGELINYTNIARECGVNRSTVESYFKILIDTLLGYNIYPYTTKVKRELIKTTPKFYFFDIGVANFLGKNKVTSLNGTLAGKSLECYILHELKAYSSYSNLDYKISYWRTKTGLEVDFILGKANIAIEVKISKRVGKSDLKGLSAFKEEHPACKAIVVSMDENKRKITLKDGVEVDIYPCEKFLSALWSKKFEQYLN